MNQTLNSAAQSATFTSSRFPRLPFRVLLTAVLSIAALPAMATLPGGAGMNGDSADMLSSPVRGVLPDAMSASDRNLLLASDLGSMVAPAANANSKPSRMQSLMQHALALLGTPYRWGGSSPDKGFDCSGLVGYVFRNTLGIELPRVSRDMLSASDEVADRAAMNTGDLVFFGRRGRVDHVGIYVGEGRFVHAPRTGRDVTVSSLDTGYWSNKFLEARRVRGI